MKKKAKKVKKERTTDISTKELLIRLLIGGALIGISIWIFSITPLGGSVKKDVNTELSGTLKMGNDPEVISQLIMQHDKEQKQEDAAVFEKLMLAAQAREEGERTLSSAPTAGGMSLPSQPPIDISNYSADEAYAVCQEIVNHPANYTDRIIKMSGKYELYVDGNTGGVYPTCKVYDKTGCCGAALEFILPDDVDYPQEGDLIEISGVFGAYKEKDKFYYAILNAELLSRKTPANGQIHVGNTTPVSQTDTDG